MFDRIEKIIGNEKIEKIKKMSVLLVGLGGVGGYAFENLVRSGFENITIIDGDEIDETNLNRQILALRNNIGEKKVEIAKKRAEQINENCKVTVIGCFLETKDITKDFVQSFDYIIDACDTTDVKVFLIETCSINKVKLISSMGTANRTHADDFEIIPLSKTKNDPLARVLRKKLNHNKNYLQTKVVCSKEVPKKQKALGTISPVPMVAGALLVSYIINDLIA